MSNINLIEWLYLKQKGNLVYYDQLTGLLNRNYFERVAKSKYLPYELYVTIVDIDNLKGTNDRHGHVSGSQRIRAVASMLKESFPDSPIMRIGGDEFIIISKEDIKLEINELISYGTCLKESYEDLSHAIKRADIKLYNMKDTHHRNNSEYFHIDKGNLDFITNYNNVRVKETP